MSVQSVERDGTSMFDSRLQILPTPEYMIKSVRWPMCGLFSREVVVKSVPGSRSASTTVHQV